MKLCGNYDFVIPCCYNLIFKFFVSLIVFAVTSTIECPTFTTDHGLKAISSLLQYQQGIYHR